MPAVVSSSGQFGAASVTLDDHQTQLPVDDIVPLQRVRVAVLGARGVGKSLAISVPQQQV